MLSLSVWPKVITLSGFFCIYLLINLFLQLRPLIRPRVFDGSRDFDVDAEPILQAQEGVGRDVVDGRNGSRHCHLLQHLPHGIQVLRLQVHWLKVYGV